MADVKRTSSNSVVLAVPMICLDFGSSFAQRFRRQFQVESKLQRRVVIGANVGGNMRVDGVYIDFCVVSLLYATKEEQISG